MLAMALVGFALSVLLRKLTYFLYALNAALVLVMNLGLQGYLYRFVLAEHPRLHEYVVMQIAAVIIPVSMMFVRRFLRLAKFAPTLHRLLGWFLGFNVLTILSCRWIPMLIYKEWLNVGLVTCISLALTAGIVSYRRGFAPARFYLLGKMTMFGFASFYPLVNAGLLPVNWVTGHLLLLATLGDLPFLLMAIGDDIYLVRRQLEQEITGRALADKALAAATEERLRLEREVTEISDKERRNISHQLHDGLCQQLAGIRIHVATLEDQLAEAGLKEKFLPVEKLLDDAVDYAYDLSRGLWSSNDKMKMPAPDLATVAAGLSALGGAEIEVEQQDVCRPCGRECLVQIHAIAREAMVNALKHSGASRITVILRCHPQRGIFLQVRDNGCGIAREQNGKKGGGMGMKIMQNRVQMIRGTLTIGAAPGGGTSVICMAPACGLASTEGGGAHD